MTLKEMRQVLTTFRTSADRDALRAKDSQSALSELDRVYRSLDVAERRLADQVISEWVTSADEGVRFDALHLVRTFALATSTLALEQLARSLAHSTSPGAPYELAKVNEILARLASAPNQRS